MTRQRFEKVELVEKILTDTRPAAAPRDTAEIIVLALESEPAPGERQEVRVWLRENGRQRT